MIVSGGENVYPQDLEDVLLQHPAIENAYVMGISDIEFGMRLAAYIVLKENEFMDNKMIFDWLLNKVARFQVPKEIYIINSIPMLSTGKIDSIQLQNYHTSKNGI